MENNIMEYFNGNLSDTERVKLEEWAALSDENKLVFDQARRLFELSELNTDRYKPDVDAAWDQVSSKLFELPKGKQVFFKIRYIYRVAAVLIFALSIGILSQVVTKNDLTTVASVSNETKNVYLPDGTKILLNENSKLRYDVDFDDDRRIVYLDGQAFFDVARDENRPFEIIGKSAKISVLGTSFDFISKSDFAHVNVSSGKVAFKSVVEPQKEVVLIKNQQAKLLENEISKSENLDENAIAWRYEDLVFKSAPLSDVVGKMAEFYEVEFEIDPTIQNCLITTSFKNQSLEEALEVLNVIANIKNKKTGKVIQLTGPGC
ncbi:MAG: FecR domain-containing protein [Reichenbachiella sp.]